MVNTGDMSVNPGNTSTLVYKYMRPEHLPHIWCPGCGNGIIMRDVAQAIENLGLSRNKTVIVSGIGCSSRAAGYLDFNTIHTTHGRAIAFATGIKLANPELEVIVLAGDGDISAIGGNHLIHAARRNIGLTVVEVVKQLADILPHGHFQFYAEVIGKLFRQFVIQAKRFPVDFVISQGSMNGAHTQLSPRLNGGDTVVGFTKPGNGWPESDREQQCQNADEQIINL